MKAFLFVPFAVAVSLVAAQSTLDTKYSDAELARLSVDELVTRYVRADPFCYECEKRLEGVLATKDPNQVFLAIAKTIDRYDPRTSAGRSKRKPEDAYWALALLWFIDNNQIRARAVDGGREAINAFARLLERKRAAGHDTGKKYEDRTRYEAEFSEYRGLLAVNGQDSRIAMQLRKAHQLELPDDELARFSDFLMAKDPRYVSWSKTEFVKPGEVRDSLGMGPYYQAYLEFKKAAAPKP